MTNNYNGWANYETWLVSLYIDYNTYYEYLTEGFDRNGLSEIIREDIINNLELETSKNYLITDLLLASIGKVDWKEIALNIIEDYE